MRALVLLALLAACKAETEGAEVGECSDRADNDADGLFDCNDPDCAGSPDCVPADADTDADSDSDSDSDTDADSDADSDSDSDTDSDTDADSDTDSDTDPVQPTCSWDIDDPLLQSPSADKGIYPLLSGDMAVYVSDAAGLVRTVYQVPCAGGPPAAIAMADPSALGPVLRQLDDGRSFMGPGMFRRTFVDRQMGTVEAPPCSGDSCNPIQSATPVNGISDGDGNIFESANQPSEACLRQVSSMGGILAEECDSTGLIEYLVVAGYSDSGLVTMRFSPASTELFCWEPTSGSPPASGAVLSADPEFPGGLFAAAPDGSFVFASFVPSVGAFIRYLRCDGTIRWTQTLLAATTDAPEPRGTSLWTDDGDLILAFGTGASAIYDGQTSTEFLTRIDPTTGVIEWTIGGLGGGAAMVGTEDTVWVQNGAGFTILHGDGTFRGGVPLTGPGPGP